MSYNTNGFQKRKLKMNGFTSSDGFRPAQSRTQLFPSHTLQSCCSVQVQHSANDQDFSSLSTSSLLGNTFASGDKTCWPLKTCAGRFLTRFGVRAILARLALLGYLVFPSSASRSRLSFFSKPDMGLINNDMCNFFCLLKEHSTKMS